MSSGNDKLCEQVEDIFDRGHIYIRKGDRAIVYQSILEREYPNINIDALVVAAVSVAEHYTLDEFDGNHVQEIIRLYLLDDHRGAER